MEEKTKGLSRRKYDADRQAALFKAEILKMVANGQTVPYVSKALGVSENLIYRWKSETKGKKKVELESASTLLSQENQQLKERVRQLEIEREILKKALAIFSRQP
jgi:transposase